MRNIDKKWTLFAIATIFTFYGICHTLVQTTFAIKQGMPIDQHFDDMNFYQCVVDSYNLEFSTDLTYEEIMDYEKLKKLSILKCNKNEDALEQDKIMSIKGIELLTSLESASLAYNGLSKVDLSKNLNLLSLDISYNNLDEIDLSNNSMLQVLNLTGNTFVDNIYVYLGDEIVLEDSINIGSKLISRNIDWEIYNKDIIDISLHDDNIVDTKTAGSAAIYGVSNTGYKIINNVYVISISSEVYEIDEDNNKIYVDDVNKFNIQGIICRDENVTLELDSNNKELFVKYNDIVLKMFVIVETNKDA